MSEQYGIMVNGELWENVFNTQDDAKKFFEDRDGFYYLEDRGTVKIIKLVTVSVGYIPEEVQWEVMS